MMTDTEKTQIGPEDLVFVDGKVQLTEEKRDQILKNNDDR